VVFCPTAKAIYFLRADWTGQITLKWFAKFLRTRTRFLGRRSDLRRAGESGGVIAAIDTQRVNQFTIDNRGDR
jgi:hypothetical protein